MLRVAFYIGFATVGHFVWEAAQVPLYTPLVDRHPREIIGALFHCTGGDILVTTATLAAAGVLAWHYRWRAFGCA